jgi:type IV secretory pathway VirB2 component (pilin)
MTQRTFNSDIRRTRLLHAFVVTAAIMAVVTLVPATAHAAGAGAGGAMPWDAPLLLLLNALSGNTAKIIAALGLVLGACIMIFGRGEDAAKRFGLVVIGAAIAIGSTSIISSLAFTGAVV